MSDVIALDSFEAAPPAATVARGRDKAAAQAEIGPDLRSPYRFLLHYVRRHALGHATVLTSVVLAVVAAVSTQYGLKHLIDIVSHGPQAAEAGALWVGFGLLCGLIAADNLLWRVGGWVAAHTFVAVTGDIRRDLFDHLSRHSPSYFAERLPGALASRVSAASNAAFTVANTTAWNVLPPCIAIVCAILLIGTVNPVMAGVLLCIAGALGALIHRLARNGGPLHRDFAKQAAAVDGELVDVIGNFSVVRAFGATWREKRRIEANLRGEMGARRASLLYMERLRLVHAVLTALLTAGIVGWSLLLWQHGQATVGDIVLTTALAFGILHGSRDLAVALVDLTQHFSRLEEAIGALLTPHELPDSPDAKPLRPGPGRVRFENVTFAYPGREPVLKGFDLTIEPG
ncbi:MAG: ABC transporter ATP-binding protein, partial [Proteobacteria bacterium]|nr:ABC transporter ATP-binding protein [Pseudomonadota bacterium]